MDQNNSKQFVLFTDSACDLSSDVLRQWQIVSVPLTFRYDDSVDDIDDGTVDAESFYTAMKNGHTVKTSAAGIQSYTDSFKKVLDGGRDILYIGFSSGLSSSFRNAVIASDDLAPAYPERKIRLVDSLSASSGLALLVYLCYLKMNQGATLEAVAEYAESIKLNVCHRFTVDNLQYLKRGGRISAVTAAVGGMLNVKPILRMDNDGHLVSVTKVKGRKASLKDLAEYYNKTVSDKSSPVFICHADCEQDVEILSGYIEELGGPRPTLISNIGSVIGAHCGPGTISAFFVGKER